MKAILLAGGLGTRLRPLTYTIPKPLIPIDDRNLTEHVFELFKKHGVDEIILSLAYMAEKIQDYFQDGKKHGVKISYCIEEKPMGTAAPFLLMKKQGKMINEDFFVANADNLFSLDMFKWMDFHKSHTGVVTIALYEVCDPSSYGVVQFENNKILRFVEKPKREEAPSCLINSGYYIVRPEIFDFIPDKEFVSMEMDVFPKLAEHGLLYGYRGEGQWFDTGTPERYEEVKRNWKGV